MKTIVVGTPPFLAMPNQGSLPNPKRRLNAKGKPYACLIYFNTDDSSPDNRYNTTSITNKYRCYNGPSSYVPVIFNGPSN